MCIFSKFKREQNDNNAVTISKSLLGIGEYFCTFITALKGDYKLFSLVQ